MEKIGKYQILEKLGQGGMGVVYKALDTLIERVVAVKMVATNLDDDPDLRTRFFREARAAGQLSHKNIVTIFDMGEEGGRAYIAMELLEGRDLRSEITKGKPLSLREKVRIVREICEGLAHAHERGVVHRDIKPANVFILKTGLVKILDFGLARTRSSELTTSGHAMGTPNYMSPEQIRGEKIDHRADIFSVGVLSYELLTGKKAFHGDSMTSTIFKILQEDPVPIESVDPGIPAALCNLVYKALAKDRDQRYQSLPELMADLDAIVQSADAISAFAADAQIVVETGTGIPREEPEDKTVVDGNTISDSKRQSISSHPTISGKLSSSQPRKTQAVIREETTRTGPAQKIPPASSSRRHFVIGSIAFLVVVSVAWIGFHFKTGNAARPETDNTSVSLPMNQEAPRKEQPANTSPPSPVVDSSAATGQAQVSDQPAQQKVSPAAEQAQKPSRTPTDEGNGQAAAPPARNNASELARRRADEAKLRLDDIKSKAEEARASKAAAQYLDAAVAAEVNGKHLYTQGKFADSEAKYASAGDLFTRAVTEARAESAANAELARKAAGERELALARTKADASRQAYESERDAAVQSGAPVKTRDLFGQAERAAAGARTKLDSGDYAGAARDYDAATTSMRVAQTAVLEAARKEASKPAETAAAPSPPPAPAQPVPDAHAAQEATQKLINAIPDQYKAAMENKDADLLKSIWPGMTAQQEQAFRKQWSYTRSLRIVPRQSKIEKMESDTAIVSVMLHYEQEVSNGTNMKWDQKATFNLIRKGRSWFIESASFQALR